LALTPEADDVPELDEHEVDERSMHATPPIISPRCIIESPTTMSSEEGRRPPMTPIELGNTVDGQGAPEEDEEKKYKVDLLKEEVGEGLEGLAAGQGRRAGRLWWRERRLMGKTRNMSPSPCPRSNSSRPTLCPLHRGCRCAILRPLVSLLLAHIL
jgi:hypothetical protein